MSSFACEVVRVQIEPHPNADAIEVALVGDYRSIVKRGQFKTGDLAVYLPEQSILPEWLLKDMGFWDDFACKGTLHGARGNRIKAIKLRGVVSQGVCYSCDAGAASAPASTIVTADGGVIDGESIFKSSIFNEGDDVSDFLGVTKYEPSVPSHMAGRVVGVDYDATLGYDFDNLKKMPTLFDDGEDVVITEKIHGTLMCVSVVPESMANEKYYKGRVSISSKGMGAKGWVLDHNDEGNLYAQAAMKHDLLEKAYVMFKDASNDASAPMFLLGEVFGTTEGGGVVQDLTYTGLPLDYRSFDICVGNRGNEKYFPWDAFSEILNDMQIPHVPLLYKGPYSKEIVQQHTDGHTTLQASGMKQQIREGCVVKSSTETKSKHFGRKIAKSVSSAYLLRKGNTTEFN